MGLRWLTLRPPTGRVLVLAHFEPVHADPELDVLVVRARAGKGAEDAGHLKRTGGRGVVGKVKAVILDRMHLDRPVIISEKVARSVRQVARSEGSSIYEG